MMLRPQPSPSRPFARAYGAGPFLVALASLGACGGSSGGATPPVTPAETAVSLTAEPVAPGATQARIRVLLTLPAGTNAALLQADLTADNAVLRPAADPVAATQNLPTAVGDWQAPGVVRILCGDAAERNPTLLTSGAVADIVFDLVAPRPAGTSTDIQMSGVQLVDPAGTPIPVAAPGTASVTLTIQ